MKFSFLIFFTLVLMNGVWAAGIGIVPSEIDLVLQEGEIQKRLVTVYNLYDKRMRLHVNSDANFILFDHEGTIEPNGKTKIEVEVSAKDLNFGKYTESLEISTLNYEGGVRLNMGSVIIANVTVLESKSNIFKGILTTIIVVVGGLFVFFLHSLKEKLLSFRKAAN